MALPATELIFTSRPETPTATDIPCLANRAPPTSTWTGATNSRRAWLSSRAALCLLAFLRRRVPLTRIRRTRISDPEACSCSQRRHIHILAAAAGKDGRLFLLDPANLGQPTNTSPPTSTPPPLDTQQSDPCWCGPSFFVGEDGISRIVTSQGNTLRTWQVQIPLDPEAAATIRCPGEQDPGFFTSISSQSSDGTRYARAKPGSAIIWAVGRPTGAGKTQPLLLYMRSTRDRQGSSPTFKQLFSATAGSWPNTGGNANIVPVVFDGKVYVASAYLDASGNTRGQLNIFGTAGTGTPLASAVAAPASPYLVSGTVTAVSGSTLTLRTRKGRPMSIDLSQAKQNRRLGGFSKSRRAPDRVRVNDRGKRRAACDIGCSREGLFRRFMAARSLKVREWFPRAGARVVILCFPAMAG